MITDETKKEIDTFLERDDVGVHVRMAPGGELEFIAFSKYPVSKEIVDIHCLEAMGVYPHEIESIKNIPRAELQRLAKLAKIQTMRKEIEILENEISKE